MEKLNLDALKLRAEAVISQNLLASISGGTENGCHIIEVVKDKSGDLIFYK